MRVVSLEAVVVAMRFLIEAGPQGRTKLLIDAGLSARLLTQRLQSVNVQLSQIQGVLVTHEHSDHVLGLPMLMKRYSIPVIADPRTLLPLKKAYGLVAGVQTLANRSLQKSRTELSLRLLPDYCF